MAKLKIGEGIQLEAQLPEKVKESRLDKVSDRVYKTDEAAQDCIKRTLQLNERLKELGVSLGIAEEKIDSNHDDILQVMDHVNKLDMKYDSTQIIKQPEIKQVTFHRDHTKDFEDVYQKLFIDKAQIEAKLKNKKVRIEKEVKRQKVINLSLGAIVLVSLLLHLI